MFVGPPFIYLYFNAKFKDWEKEEFEDSLGTVLEGLNKKKRSVVYYPVLFMIRRLLICVIAIYVQSYFAMQMSAYLFLSLV